MTSAVVCAGWECPQPSNLELWGPEKANFLKEGTSQLSPDGRAGGGKGGLGPVRRFGGVGSSSIW